MMLSAEIRWFWKNGAPSGLFEWFIDEKVHGCKPGGGPPGRDDIYLIGDDLGELGIKVRGNKGEKKADDPTSLGPIGVEVKGLIAVDRGVLSSGVLAGPVEFWCKWPFPNLDVGRTKRCEVNKIRWLRKFDTTGAYPTEMPLGPDEKPKEKDKLECLPAHGCNVEMTEIRAPNGEKWFSLGFEAFGDLRTISDDLRVVATIISQRGTGPDIHGGECLSYPRWISRYAKPAESTIDPKDGP
jgi:hypothetical protein